VVGLLHDFDRLDIDPWRCAPAWTASSSHKLGAPVLQGQHILVVGHLKS
jgi:hypothetical protein